MFGLSTIYRIRISKKLFTTALPCNVRNDQTVHLFLSGWLAVLDSTQSLILFACLPLRHTFLALLGKDTSSTWAGPKHLVNVGGYDVGVLPEGSLPLDCVTHYVFGCVDHPLVQMEDSSPLAFDEFMQATPARMA